MSIFTEKREKPSKGSIFVIVFLLVVVLLALAFPAAAQDTDIFITIDQGPQVADFTVNDDITISLTGEYSISTDSLQPVTVYFGIHAPEGWVTSILPESLTVTFGNDASGEFEGEITPNSGSEQKAYDVFVWASAEGRNYGEIDWSSSPSSSERVIWPIELILNRVKVITDTLERLVLPEQTITHTFTVSNVATVVDTFFIDLVNDEALKDQGWIITQSEEELILEPGEEKTFSVEWQVPQDASKGDYEIEVVVSASGHATSKSSQSMVTKVRLPKTSTPFWTFGLILMVAFVGTGIGLAALFGVTQYGYLALMSLFLPLYVRLKKKDVLSHFTRGQIFGYIQANPGAHYNAIIQDLGLQNGVGAYHLKVLEREGFIKSMRDGIYKRFYPSDMKIPEKRVHLSRVQKDILKEIQKHPGVTQKQISKLLDESKQVVNYNVKVLETASLIRVERVGRGTACFAGNVRYIPDEDIYELAEEKVAAPMMQI
jgi:predicted transcriptional regulator